MALSASKSNLTKLELSVVIIAGVSKTPLLNTTLAGAYSVSSSHGSLLDKVIVEEGELNVSNEVGGMWEDDGQHVFVIEASSSSSLLKKKSKDRSKSRNKSRSGSSKGLHGGNVNCNKRDHHNYLSLNDNGTTNLVAVVVVLDAEELFCRVPYRRGRMEWWY